MRHEPNPNNQQDDAERDNVGDDLAFFGRMKKTHAEKRRKDELSGCAICQQGAGAGNHSRGKLFLEGFVSLGVGHEEYDQAENDPVYQPPVCFKGVSSFVRQTPASLTENDDDTRNSPAGRDFIFDRDVHGM